jgi:hypothetical protein
VEVPDCVGEVSAPDAGCSAPEGWPVESDGPDPPSLDAAESSAARVVIPDEATLLFVAVSADEPAASVVCPLEVAVD